MNKIKLFIFDLDGTLADTSPGIYECHRFTNLKMRGKAPSDEQLRGIIGGPLLNSYINRFGYSEQEARQAVAIYREHYATEGIKGAVLYPGICDTLSGLKKQGYLTAVATLKGEKLAKDILARLDIDKYFDIICGMDDRDSLTKTDLVRKCLNELNCLPEQAVLVGDSEYDAKGADMAQVGFIGCTYGFGFAVKEEALAYDPIAVISRPIELLSCIV